MRSWDSPRLVSRRANSWPPSKPPWSGGCPLRCCAMRSSLTRPYRRGWSFCSVTSNLARPSVRAPQKHDPAVAPVPRRQRECQRLMMCVEQRVEARVHHSSTARVGVRDALAVEKDAEGFGEALSPVAFGHLGAVGLEPADVGLGPADGAALEPAAAPERGVRASQTDEAAGELLKALIGVLPIEPGDLVVLAVRVVVAALRAPHLVAAKQHGHALREKKRGEEVTLLARA